MKKNHIILDLKIPQNHDFVSKQITGLFTEALVNIFRAKSIYVYVWVFKCYYLVDEESFYHYGG